MLGKTERPVVLYGLNRAVMTTREDGQLEVEVAFKLQAKCFPGCSEEGQYYE